MPFPQQPPVHPPDLEEEAGNFTPSDVLTDSSAFSDRISCASLIASLSGGSGVTEEECEGIE
jgi:hypothetical protein